MQDSSNAIIDLFGGTTAVSRLTKAPVSTVHSWRKIGIPRSRLAHLALLIREAKAENRDQLEKLLALKARAA
jgi:hypothetical protein